MKNIITIALILIAASAGAQHHTSSVQTLVKIKHKRGETKIVPKEVYEDTLTIYALESLLILKSAETKSIPLELFENKDDVTVWNGHDNDLNAPCRVFFLRFNYPHYILLSYGKWGIIYFID